eukprot:4432190-Prymnesium_polylepis.1
MTAGHESFISLSNETDTFCGIQPRSSSTWLCDTRRVDAPPLSSFRASARGGLKPLPMYMPTSSAAASC